MTPPPVPPMLSPCSTEHDIKRYTSSTPDSNLGMASPNMLKIQYLLNPSASDETPINHFPGSMQPPFTTGYTQASVVRSTPPSAAPSTPSSSKRFKADDNDAVFNHGENEDTIKYPPFESHDDAFCLSSAEREELARQHKLFDIKYRSEDKIADHPKFIPYASEKKSFGGKTGREGFNGRSSSSIHHAQILTRPQSFLVHFQSPT